MYMDDFIVNKKDLGKRISDVRIINNINKETAHILVYTGIIDFTGDEIVLTVLPDQNIVTDEGYTDYALESINGSLSFSNVSILINSYKVRVKDGMIQNLEHSFTNDNYMDSVKQLTACIIDIYASLVY